MSVTGYRITQYYCECDVCGKSECCPDSKSEDVHSVQDAIKWAGLHRIADGRVLCDKCFAEYKLSRKKK